MTPTLLVVLLAVGGFLAFVYFTSDLAVLLRGPDAVPPAILRLARAGDRRIAKGSLLHIAITAGAAALFFLIPALWLVFRRSEIDAVGQLFLAGGLIAEGLWVATLARVASRGAPQQP